MCMCVIKSWLNCFIISIYYFINLNIDFIINFCDYFKIALSEFFDEGKKYPLEYKELFENLNKLSKEELKVISDVAQMFAKNKK